MADEDSYDPVADWMDSKPWDRKSRIAEICETVVPVAGYPVHLRNVLVRKWLLSIVAATYTKSGFRARGVLTLQGGQGIGKTSWFARLITPPDLRDDCIKLGHSWDRGSKDARLGAIRHRIVEFGELEGSMRYEMASLKAFITEPYDKIRVPYAVAESEYPRSTIFAATVNDQQFLRDTTGNSRFWTIEVEKITFEHGIDMQQVFAELKVQFEDGVKWYLSNEEELELAGINDRHRVMSAIEVRIREEIDPNCAREEGLPKLTANEVLKRLDFPKPTNAQSKEANVALRALLGDPKRIQGQNRWRIPWAKDEPSHRNYEAENTY